MQPFRYKLEISRCLNVFDELAWCFSIIDTENKEEPVVYTEDGHGYCESAMKQGAEVLDYYMRGLVDKDFLERIPF